MSRRNRDGLGSSWEDSRGEFYQEHFPSAQAGMQPQVPVPRSRAREQPLGSTQLELLNSLPSRQLLHTVDGVTMSRSQMTRTLGQRKSGLTVKASTVSQTGEVVAEGDALPDQDEQQIWNQIQAIKAMPIPMARKRERKDKLLHSPAFKSQGMKRFHLHRQKFWSHFKDAMVDIFSFELWHDSLRLIEGNLGTGVLSYFHYIKKVMYMNLSVFLAMLFLVVLPDLILRSGVPPKCDLADNKTATDCCFNNYADYVHNNSWGGVGKGFMDFLQGTGYMELTPLFYGFYEDRILTAASGMKYNLPLAYVVVALSCLLLSLVYVVMHTAHGFQDAILSRGKFYQYCNVVLSAWDFCIDNSSAAEYKQKAIYNELKGYLEMDQYETERRNRSKLDTIQLYVVRTVTNIIVTVILIICGFIIFYVVRFSLTHVEEEAAGKNRATWLTIYQYMPAMTVSGLNIVVTLFMYHIVELERYTPQVNVILTLVRTLFLRVASIAVLMYSFFHKYNASCAVQLDEFQCFAADCRASSCWETIIGQTCYKLMLTDFACIAGLSIAVYFPMRLVADHYQEVTWMNSWFVQEFEIPRHVLDVVYNQTLCWLGVFYSPLLPGIAAFICFCYFHLKKFTCTRICTPPSLSLHSIRSSAFYMLVSLFSFFAALLIVIYSLAEVRPSRSCGPFRGLDTMWMEVHGATASLPSAMRSFLNFFWSAGFAVPLLVVLLLAMYYYSAIAAANKHMIGVLKEQLVLEGHDKQFLLGKLNELNSLQRDRLMQRRRNVIGERMFEGVHFAEMGAASDHTDAAVVTHQEL